MIISFSGYPGAGKDECCKILAALETPFKHISFAEPMRRALYNLNPIVGSEDYLTYQYVIDRHGYDSAKRRYPEIRRLMQKLGTEAGRDIHGPYCWVRIARKEVEKALTEGMSVCVSDTRFPNEFNYLKSVGAKFIKIVNPESESNHNHASESFYDRFVFDAEIQNKKSDGIAALKEKLLNTISSFDQAMVTA